MSSRDKFYGVQSADHGFDDMGFAQPTGAINSVAQYKAGKFYKYALVTAAAAHGLTPGQTVNISGTTYYDGPTRVLATPSTTTFVIKRAFAVTATGSWDGKVAEGNWDAVMPIGAGATGGTNITFTFWKPNQAGGSEALPNLVQDKVYPMPSIKRVAVTQSGNLRLFRAASTKPSDGKNLALPTIVAYNPTGAAVGATIDILGTNFDPVPDRNAVRFFSGKYANVISATEEILTIIVPTGASSGYVAVVANGGQNATGPTFNVN